MIYSEAEPSANQNCEMKFNRLNWNWWKFGFNISYFGKRIINPTYISLIGIIFVKLKSP